MNLVDILNSWFITADGAFAVDDYQRIIHWNQGADSILGYTSDDVLGKYCYEVIRGKGESGIASCTSDCPAADGAQCGKLAGGQNLQCVTKSGSTCWISLSHVFMRRLEGTLDGVIHIFREVTQEVESKNLLASPLR